MEKTVFQGNIIEVVQKEVNQNGRSKTFEFARRSPGVRLIIISGDKILLTKEYRNELRSYDFRLPGGKVFDSLAEYNNSLTNYEDEVESAKLAAIKEAKEEVGIVVNKIEYLSKSICGATVVWDLYYFLVSDYELSKQDLEDGEDISVELVDLDKARRMCLDGAISEERSALVLLRYLSEKV